jgi:hypothetical protein
MKRGQVDGNLEAVADLICQRINDVNNSNARLCGKIAILWTARELFSTSVPQMRGSRFLIQEKRFSLTLRSSPKMASLCLDKKISALTQEDQGSGDFYYKVARNLLESQKAINPSASVPQLKDGFDCGVVSKAIFLLQNKKNDPFLRAWFPTLKEREFDLSAFKDK